MFLAHSFRLRDPWHCERTADGGTRWSRVFHRPTGLEPDDELWLVCSGLPPGAQVTMNDHRLPLPPDVRRQPSQRTVGSCATGVPPVRTGEAPGAPKHARSTIPSLPNQFDVTPILADANRIEVLVPAAVEATENGPQRTTSSLQPPASSLRPHFPYDVRLGVVAVT